MNQSGNNTISRWAGADQSRLPNIIATLCCNFGCKRGFKFHSECWPFALFACKFEQPIPFGSLRPHAPRAPSASIRGNRNRYPCYVECESGKKDELTGNGSNRCSHPKLLHRGHRRRMDEQFTNVCGHLDRENPAVVIPKPAAHRVIIGNVKVRGSVILIENLVPAILDLNALTTEDWPEELDFEDMCSHAPKIKEAV